MLASELVAILNRAIAEGKDYKVFFTEDPYAADPVKRPVRYVGGAAYWCEDEDRYSDAAAGDCIALVFTCRGEHVSK